MTQNLDHKELRTERLALRSPRPTDAARVAELISNWNVIRWLTRPPYPYQRSDAEDFVRCSSERTGEHGAATFAIEIEQKFAGVISYRRQKAGTNLGYWLGEPYWGQGIMSEAVAAVLDRYFASPDYSELESGIIAGNPASLRIQEKFGFEVVGQSEVYCVPRGRKVPHIGTRLTRERYKALQS